MLATSVLALQAGLFGTFAVVLVADAAERGELTAALPTSIFVVLVAFGAALVGVGLWRRRRWARGPAVAWSVLVVLVGASQIAVNPPVGIAIVAVGLLGAGSAAAPSTRAALTGEPTGARSHPSN